MRQFSLAAIALVSSLAAAAAAPASAFWPSFQARAGWAPLPPHTPAFRVQRASLSMLGSAGPYQTAVYEIRDAAAGDGIVAVYVPAASEDVEGWKQGATPELLLLAPTPALALPALPPLPRYGWAWLWGAKLVTIPWLDCCNVTGDTAGFAFSAAGAAQMTLSQAQTWVPSGNKPGRDAQSLHTFTLLYDSAIGYRIDVVASLRINAAAAPARVEFVNFLTPHLANPWPAPNSPNLLGPRSNVTAWTADAGTSWRGFAQNLLAGAMLHTYNISANASGSGLGAVAMAAAGGWSAALAHGGGDGLAYLQATCPTWMDQHQIVELPPAGADGYVRAAPTFSHAYLPPAGAAAILGALDLISHAGDGSRGNGSAVMLRVGVLEDFSQQPVPLTQPLRALVSTYYNPDYSVVAAGALRAGRALRVPALAPAAAAGLYAFANPQPLIPLNGSTAYVAQAAALPPPPGACAGGAARLVVLLYEDDDFNTPARLLEYASVNASGGAWAPLRAAFVSPPWVSYADVRLEALAPAAPAACNASALFADFFFGLAAGAPPQPV
jgi:hypothetical protein